MKPGRFIFAIVILLSCSLYVTGAPVKTDDAQLTPTYDEAWMNSLLPQGVTMEEIRDWEAGMTDNRKSRYQDALERDIKFQSEGKQMTAQELLALRIECQGFRFRRYHFPIHNPKAAEADLKKIFRPGLTKQENEKNAQLFETLDDGDDPAEEQWKNSLLRPDITMSDIHGWESSSAEVYDKLHRDALRQGLVDGAAGKELKPKQFKALLINLKEGRYMGSRRYRSSMQNLKLENVSEGKLLPPYVTMAMVKNWEDTMSEKDKEIYSKALNAELKKFSKHLGTNAINARLLKLRGKQYAMAQEKRRHANPLTPAQKAEITTWIENLNLKEFPPEADDARTDKLLSPGVSMEIIRRWEAAIPNFRYINALKRDALAWMADEIPLPEIQYRSIRYRRQRYLESQGKNSRKRKREETRMAEEAGTQPPNSSRGNSATPPKKRTHTREPTPNHGEPLNTPNASPSIANSAPFHNPNPSRKNTGTPSTLRTHSTEATSIYDEPPNTPKAPPSIAHSPLPVTLPAHLMIDADKHAVPQHPEYPPGTISLEALEKIHKRTSIDVDSE